MRVAGHARTAVDHFAMHHTLVAAAAKPDSSPFWRKLHGIADEVDQYLEYPAGITDDISRSGVEWQE